MRHEHLRPEHVPDCAGIFAEAFAQPPWSGAWSAVTAEARLHEIVRTPGFVGLVAVVGDAVAGTVAGAAQLTTGARAFFARPGYTQQRMDLWKHLGPPAAAGAGP